MLENRRRLCAALGLPLERLVVPGQVHGTTLAWVGEAEAGRGTLDSPSVIKEHDGLLTARRGLGLVVSYADCVPVVIVADGEEGPRFATVHAGWRGMIAGIVGQAAAELAAARPPASAPSSGRASARAASPSTTSCGAGSRPGSRAPPAPPPSTSGAARGMDLEAAGVPPAAVSVAGLCTASRRALLLAPPRRGRDRPASRGSLAAGSVGRSQK